MPHSKDHLRTELDRRFAIVIDHIMAERPIDFELFLRMHDYVDFIEHNPTLLLCVEADKAKWEERIRKLPADGLSMLGRFRRRFRLRSQSDFHFFCSYWNLLQAYYAINYLKGINPPNDFEWNKSLKKAVSDMEDIQLGLTRGGALLLFGNSFFFRKSQYRKWLERVHNALLAELSKPGQKTGLSFDRDKSILTIGDKAVRITLKNDKPNAHYVLEYLFDHGVTERAHFSEIIEDKFLKERMDWRSVYRACQDIQEKVREQAQINDFLDTTTGKTGYTAINPLYA